MVARAVNFKAVVPRQSDPDKRAAVIWNTHDLVNLGTYYYKDLLLTLRQRPIIYRDGREEGKDQLRARAIVLADRARVANGKCQLTNYEDTLSLFRQLYEALVPSAIEEKGNAQNALTINLAQPDEAA